MGYWIDGFAWRGRIGDSLIHQSKNPCIEPPMNSVIIHPLDAAEAALWWLGQAGYVVRAGAATVAIDPYLTDSAAANAPEFARLFPPPIAPEDLRADIFVI